MTYTAMGSIQSTASAVAAIATDPYLPEVTNLVLKLKSLEKSSGARAEGSTGTGVGLRNVVGPLRLFVKIQEKPWILPATVVGIFGMVFAAGYYTRKLSTK